MPYDTDNDGQDNVDDPDDDGDGVDDPTDNCSLVPNADQADLDGDGESRAIGCAGGSRTDALETTAAAGASGLTYDAATDRYTYVWKSQKSWAKSCRELVVTLADGSTHTALFQFK